MITKSDFRLYLDSPMHLWAQKHHQYQADESVFAQKLTQEGYKVEKLALQYLADFVIIKDHQLTSQVTFTDGDFQARVDGLIYHPQQNNYDLYEIKSSTYDPAQPTKIDQKNLFDLAFQTLILQSQLPLQRQYLLLLNKNYVRQGDLQLDQLFIAVDVSQQIAKLLPTIKAQRQLALAASQQTTPTDLTPCFNPRTCGCPALCHPHLPEHHIYQVFATSRPSLEKLRAAGINDLFAIPTDFPLTAKQAQQLRVYQDQTRILDIEKIRQELASLTFPLYFLDYETNDEAIPPFTGYHPHQHQAVQYSLHVLKENGAQQHFAYVHLGETDPMRATLTDLFSHLGDRGSILVWNEAFEKSVNDQAAQTYPDLAEPLLAVNQRIVDLANSFKKLYFLDRQFYGSWSIKKVLPVLCPDLSYQDLPINKGDLATAEWARMNSSTTTDAQKAQIKKDLLTYCALDTWAMVRIWQELGKV